VCSGVGPVGHRPIPRRGAAGRRFPLSAHRGMAGSPLTGRELATQVFHGTTPSPASPGYTYPATRPVVTGAPAKTDSTSSRKAHSLASETPPPTAETNGPNTSPSNTWPSYPSCPLGQQRARPTFHQPRSADRPTTASRRLLPGHPECVGRLRLERGRATGSRHHLGSPGPRDTPLGRLPPFVPDCRSF
jgi:hypothetical protein